MKRVAIVVALSMLTLATLLAQTVTSGDVTGTITDQTGAVLPNATVTLKNNATGAAQTTTTNAQGFYRFPFQSPGSYTVTAEVKGFQKTERQVNVALGQAATANLQLELGVETQTVMVTETAGGVDTENANVSTTYDARQVDNMPNPGNDMTYIAQTAPGAVMNTQAGYGNFSTYGMPATSNLFTINGQDDNDPYFNTNNSGATNLTLGTNEIDQATVVNNGYTGQYGTLAGANVNYVTKHGGNSFHGNAIWLWNGRFLNANNFFNNASGVSRPFVNANQWAASVGGPVWKNHTFFFFDYEGLRVVLPTSQEAFIPSPQFAAATIANLNAKGLSNQVPFYQNIFNLYKNAPGAAAATPVPGGGCAGFTGLGAGAPCALQFRSIAGNFTHEYMWAGRVDQNIGNNDRAYVRVSRDNGTQATFTDPINPAFNAFSNQPQMQGQISETHTFGATAVNQFILAGLYYRAQFGPSNRQQQLSVFPTTIQFTGRPFTTMGGEDWDFPQGRNVTQYQIIDDVSKQAGRHTIKFGVNFRRNDISDWIFSRYTIGRMFVSDLGTFFNGGGSGAVLRIHYPTSPVQPIALYSLGLYAQDEIRVSPSLNITLALRGDHFSNPVCQHNCFARLAVPFTQLAHNADVPYNQVIQNGLHQAYSATDNIVWQPRFGFAWAPGSRKTVIRGGVGIFADAIPATLVDDIAQNTPQLNAFNFSSASGLIAPGVPNSVFSLAGQANQSLISAFNSGKTLAQIQAANPSFVVPSFTALDRTLKVPRYYEWNLEVQRSLPWRLTASVNYVGNHGAHELIQDTGINAYCDPATCPGGFTGLPAAPPDPRFGTVTQVMTNAFSNYNGVTGSLRRSFGGGFQMVASYTFSHALDVVSNAGVLPYNFNTNNSILYPQDPYHANKYNYGNADYDATHSFNLTYVWTDLVRHFWKGGPNPIFGGWTIGGNLFTRSGLPFTVIDGGQTTALQALNYGGEPNAAIFATPVAKGPHTCGKSGVNTPCFAKEFAPSPTAPTGFGNQSRNQYRGPGFFSTDLMLMKSFPLPRWETARISLSAQAFNLFNHPNFDQPTQDITSPQFGQILLTAAPPTGVAGSFLGADTSPRMIQVRLQFQF